jgi:class 3 adenylate cyclase
VKNRTRQLFTLSAIVVVAAAAAVDADYLLPVVRVAENWSRDLRVATLTPPEPQSRQIVGVTVTEDTLAAFAYRSPLDRRFVSDLLRSLEAKGARLVALDMLLDQPSEPDKDMELQETLRTLSVPVVVASAEISDGLTERQAAFMAEYLDGIPRGIPMVSTDSIDGTVRGIELRRRHEGQPQFGFVAAVADALGITITGGDSLTLRFRGAPDPETPPFATYPAHAVALLPDAWIRDRIVLIGADLNLADRHRTPFSVIADGGADEMPGVLLQAHALSQVIEGRHGPNGPAWQGALVTVAFALIGALVVMCSLAVVIKAIILLVAMGAIWTGGFALFQYSGQLLPVVAPTLALGLAAGLSYAWRWRDEQVHRRFIQNAFSKFVAPAVVEHMLENPDRLRLGGERRDVTFLFTDIADYTRLTENTEPALLVTIMNAYFDGTCAIVYEHGGTIDKFVGDALHIMFNAPLEQPDHPERAVACAVALDAYCRAFASRQQNQAIDFGVTRIGVNTGIAVVGNFGGAQHFDYTATGDAINSAARLESVNKQVGTRVCIGGTTIDRCHAAKVRPVGELVLKGKSESIVAFEPVPNDDDSYSGIDEYMAAYGLLSAKDPQAERALRELARRYPADALVAFHLQRLAAGESGSLIVMKEK